MSFYNTNNESGDELRNSREQAVTQEALVHDWFMNYGDGGSYTPFEVQQSVLPNCPVTSARRAMTNLSDQGVLKKTNHMRREQWGKLNHTWKLKEKDTNALAKRMEPCASQPNLPGM